MNFVKYGDANLGYMKNGNTSIPLIMITDSGRFKQIFETVMNRKKVTKYHVLNLSLDTISKNDELKIRFELTVKDSDIQDWFVFDAIENYTFVRDVLESKFFCISSPIGNLFITPPEYNQVLEVTNQIMSYLASGVK